MKTLLTFIVLAASCTLAIAQGTGPGARFVCGGVGLADQARMKAEASGYDAMLTFATSSGAYMADVDVRITTADGRTVLQAKCDGPLMLVDLPGKGRYRVTATAEGKARQKDITVGERTSRAVFTWPAS